jgi:hypothetical protein
MKRCAPPSYPRETRGTHAIRRQFGAAGRLFKGENVTLNGSCQTRPPQGSSEGELAAEPL